MCDDIVDRFRDVFIWHQLYTISSCLNAVSFYLIMYSTSQEICPGFVGFFLPSLGIGQFDIIQDCFVGMGQSYNMIASVPMK